MTTTIRRVLVMMTAAVVQTTGFVMTVGAQESVPVDSVALPLAATVLPQVEQQTEQQPEPQTEQQAEQPQVIVGYLSYSKALEAMPEYAAVADSLKQLKAQYEAEQQRTEREFNRKYEQFLDGQRDFPKTILQKRQTELQQLMQQGIDFKNQAKRELAEAEQQAMKPLRQRLDKALADLAAEYSLVLVINTDSNAAPFIDPLRSIDLQPIIDTAY